MIAKVAPLMVLGMAAQSYYNKTKKGKKEMKGSMKKAMEGDRGNLSKGDLNKDGKMSGYEKARSKAIQKAILKKRKKKGMSNSSNTGDGTSAAQGRSGK